MYVGHAVMLRPLGLKSMETENTTLLLDDVFYGSAQWYPAKGSPF